MFKSFLLELNISAVQTNYIFAVNSNDLNTIRLDLVIKDNSALVDLTGKIVRLAIRKPDNTVVFQSGGVTDGPGGKCEFILGKQASLVPGRHEGEVMIYEGDSTVAVTTKFYYEVKRAALSNSDVESSSDFPAISQAIAAGEILKEIDIHSVINAGAIAGGVQEEMNLAKQKEDGTLFGTVQERLNDADIQLKNTNIKLMDTIPKINPMRSPFNVKGNANYFSESSNAWYTDSSKTTLSNDDAAGIRAFLDYVKTNKPYESIVFPKADYLIKSTIVIPQECRNIDFGFSTFHYLGEPGTFCITGGAITTVNPQTNVQTITGGYILADWSNLTINGNYNVQSYTCKGMDVTYLRNARFNNITIRYMDLCVQAGDTWTTSFNNLKLYYSNMGVDTGRACNGVNFSKLDVMNCKIGMRIGKGGAINNGNWGINCLTIDNASLFQQCDTALELHFIKSASVVNGYFENCNRVIDIPLITVDENIANFTFDSNHVDIPPANVECFLRIMDGARPINMNITKNTFTGYKPTNTMFHRASGIVGNLGHWNVTDNTFNNLVYTDIFPDNWKIQAVKTDIPFIPVIDTANWTIVQPVRILPLGQSRFEISGAIKRITGKTSTLLCAVPYYFTSDSYNVYANAIQAADASPTIKNVTIEAKTWPKTLNIFTVDTTDLNTINFSGVVWCTR